LELIRLFRTRPTNQSSQAERPLNAGAFRFPSLFPLSRRVPPRPAASATSRSTTRAALPCTQTRQRDSPRVDCRRHEGDPAQRQRRFYQALEASGQSPKLDGYEGSVDGTDVDRRRPHLWAAPGALRLAARPLPTRARGAGRGPEGLPTADMPNPAPRDPIPRASVVSN
jgi:hypothetical protein